MRKTRLLASLSMLCCALTMTAQNDVFTAVLQHGNEARAFVGMNALVEAHEAAVDGDQISLSMGTFNSPTITKSVSIYGAGFEDDEATGTAVTALKGNLTIGARNDSVRDVRVEGVYVNANIHTNTNSMVEGLTITKSFVNGNIHFYGQGKNVEISHCVLTNSVRGENVIVASMQIKNCYIGGNVSNFNVSSSIQADHCIICADYSGAILYTNCVLTNGFITSSAIAEGATVYNCLTNGQVPTSNRIVRNCYPVATSQMFADADNASYSPTRTFELKNPEEWLGNDGTQVGILGGQGFVKAPGTPAVKNLQLQVEGKQLRVTYEAEVR